MDGYVERVSERQLSKQVEFKPTLDETKTIPIPASEIERLIFTEDSAVFQKVPYGWTGDSGSNKAKEFRLAKKMVTGFAELYKLQLSKDEAHIIHKKSNTFIYLLKLDTLYHVLDQQEKRIDPYDKEFSGYHKLGYNYVVINNYKKTLSTIFENRPELQQKIRNLKLQDSHIIPLITKFNATHPEVPGRTLVSGEKILVAHGPLFGFTNVSEFSGEEKNVEWGYQVRVVHPEISERLSHQIGFSLLLPVLPEGSEIVGSNPRFKIPVSSRYTLYRGRLSPFIGIGLSFFLDDGYGFFNVVAGTALHQQWEVVGKIETSEMRMQIPQTFTIQFAYSFGKTQ